MPEPQDIAAIDIAALREAAEAATPGPWTTSPSKYVPGRYVHQDRQDGIQVRHATVTADEDARFIATFDPPTVLALLSEVERGRALRAAVEALAEEWEDCGCAVCWHRAASRELRAALSGEDS